MSDKRFTYEQYIERYKTKPLPGDRPKPQTADEVAARMAKQSLRILKRALRRFQ